MIWGFNIRAHYTNFGFWIHSFLLALFHLSMSLSGGLCCCSLREAWKVASLVTGSEIVKWY